MSHRDQKLHEVIPGIATSKETLEAVTTLSDGLAKTTVIAADFPAFIVNRILIPTINEAVYTLYEGIGSIVDIDRA